MNTENLKNIFNFFLFSPFLPQFVRKVVFQNKLKI